MNFGFYPKLALTGIRKNGRLYVPYLLTCICMVMMFYIIAFLSMNEGVGAMQGGETLQAMLSFGYYIMGVFSLIFLFYTNSFLIRRRKKEFGLYNILGMGKWNIARILVWESLIVTAVSLAGGLLCGVLFSKLAELVMVRMLGGQAAFNFTVDFSCIAQTVVLFAAIFLLILLKALRQIHVSNPVELLHSENVGEKPPKANWLVALVGAVLLGTAYVLAVTISDPISALVWFFVAVLMVILATYLLFIAGSVVFCKLLQKNKRYYYKTNHFVSVSSMMYRMKRNGAGLASICILSTMVLVMISSTMCLYIGAEDNLRSRYPRNIVVDTYSIEESQTSQVHTAVASALEEAGLQAENELHYRYLDVAGYFDGAQVIFDQNKIPDFGMSGYSSVRQLFIVPLEDYNRLMGTNETLEKNEVLIYTTKDSYDYDTITMEGCDTLRVKKVVTEFEDNGVDTMQVISSVFLFVPDFDTMEQIFDAQAEIYGDNRSYKHDYYGFDLSCDDATQVAVYDKINTKLAELSGLENLPPRITVECAAKERADFYGLYGGLLSLGVLLGSVFVLGAVLIMYYRQVTEGYEDQDRFDILQKVGMTKREIRKSINSQMLTVFFLPLITAGVHMAFAFPLISKLLMLFGLSNIGLLVAVTVGCYLVFSLFYVLVYAATSRAYYGIVSGKSRS